MQGTKYTNMICRHYKQCQIYRLYNHSKFINSKKDCIKSTIGEVTYVCCISSTIICALVWKDQIKLQNAKKRGRIFLFMIHARVEKLSN